MKKVYSFILIIFLVFTLCSCGKKTDYTIESGEFISDINIIANARFDFSDVKISNDLISYRYIDSYFNDNIYDYLVFDNFSSDYYFVSFDLNGKNSTIVSLEKPFIYNNNSITPSDNSDCVLISEEVSDYSILSYSSPIPFFDAENNISGICEIYGESYDGEYVSYLKKNYLVTWDFSGKIVSVSDDLNSLSLSDNSSFIQSINSYWSLTNTGIVLYDSEGKYSSEFFDYINSSFEGNLTATEIADESHFSGIAKNSDGNMSFYVFSKSNDDISSRFTPVSIYCQYLDDSLKTEILKYNNTNSKYRIGVRDYSVICRDYSITESEYVIRHNSLQMLQSDILAGDTPDMIFDTDGLDYTFVSVLGHTGFAADVSKLFGEDEFKNNGFALNISGINGCSEENRSTYATVVSFTYNTYIGSEYREGICKNWNMSDLTQFRDYTGADAVVIDTLTSYDFLKKSLKYNGFSWIEINNATAKFNCDEYISVLEYANNLPDSMDDFNSFSMNGLIPVNIGAFERMIGNLDEYYLFGSRILGSSPVDIGFPSDYASGRVLVPDCSFVINRNSASSAVCWEFGRSLLSSKYQDTLTASIPVLNSSLESWKNNTIIANSQLDRIFAVDGQAYMVGQMSDEQANECIQMIRNCNTLYFEDPFIEDIVLDIAAEYFNGTITVNEAAERTEREVNDYLQSVLKQ